MPVAFTIAIGASAPSIVDSAGCPQDANATPCQSILTVSDSYGTESQDTCTMNSGTPQPASQSWTVGPFAADGPQVFAFACSQMQFQQAATASITLSVVPPVRPQADTLTGSYSGNIETLTWITHSAQGAGGCSVLQLDNFGNQVTLNPGGTLSGSASTGFLSPSLAPFTFELICSGVLDAGVPTITVSP